MTTGCFIECVEKKMEKVVGVDANVIGVIVGAAGLDGTDGNEQHLDLEWQGKHGSSS
jgi:hypothetical protein